MTRSAPIFHLRFPCFASLLGLILSTQCFAVQLPEQFPLRQDYPGVKTIELEELHANMHDYVVIDVRSSYEFQTLHIKGAINIPLSDGQFMVKVREAYKAARKPLVTYCNGESCAVSFQAAELVHEEGIPVLAYDAGVWFWALNYSDESVLLGKIGAKTLISPEQFNARLLSPAKFEELADTDVLLIDVRTRRQAGYSVRFWPLKQRNVELGEDDLAPLLAKASRDNRTVLVYDATGHQVRWVQYAIERAGIKNYWFLEGGAKAYDRYRMTDEWRSLSDSMSSEAEKAAPRRNSFVKRQLKK